MVVFSCWALPAVLSRQAPFFFPCVYRWKTTCCCCSREGGDFFHHFLLDLGFCLHFVDFGVVFWLCFVFFFHLGCWAAVAERLLDQCRYVVYALNTFMGLLFFNGKRVRESFDQLRWPTPLRVSFFSSYIYIWDLAYTGIRKWGGWWRLPRVGRLTLPYVCYCCNVVLSVVWASVEKWSHGDERTSQ